MEDVYKRQVQLIGLVGIVKDHRMQVSIAGMKHIGDAQVVLYRQLPDSRQRLRQFAARDGAVHAVIIGRDAADRRKRRLTAGPEQQPLLFGIRGAAGHRTALPRDLLDAIEQMVDFGARAIQLDDQERLDIERIAGMDEFLGGVDGRPCLLYTSRCV